MFGFPTVIWTSERRLVAVAVLATMMLVSVLSGAARAQSSREETSRLQNDLTSERAFLNEYCVSCHNTKLKTPAGALALDTADIENVSGSAPVWEKVVRKLHARAMPPPGPDGVARTTASTIALSRTWKRRWTVQLWIRPNPGRSETFHRLNRAAVPQRDPRPARAGCGCELPCSRPTMRATVSTT